MLEPSLTCVSAGKLPVQVQPPEMEGHGFKKACQAVEGEEPRERWGAEDSA